MRFAAAALIGTTYAVKLTPDGLINGLNVPITEVDRGLINGLIMPDVPTFTPGLIPPKEETTTIDNPTLPPVDPTEDAVDLPETMIFDGIADFASHHIDDDGNKAIDNFEWTKMVDWVSDQNVKLGLGLTEADREGAMAFWDEISTCWGEGESRGCAVTVEDFETAFAAALAETDFTPYVAKIAELLEDPATAAPIFDGIAAIASHHIDASGDDVIDVDEWTYMIEWVAYQNDEFDLGLGEDDVEAAWDFFYAGATAYGEGDDMAFMYIVEDFETDFAAALAETDFSPIVAKIAELFEALPEGTEWCTEEGWCYYEVIYCDGEGACAGEGEATDGEVTDEESELT